MLVTPESDYTMIVEAVGYHTLSKNMLFESTSLFGSSMDEIRLVPIEQQDISETDE